MMSSILGKLRLQSSMKPTKGRAVSVYDGRSWPVVKCGPVYVTEDEKAKHVTKNVIAQSTASEDKKKKSSKYTVAVGSTFGHVHTFLKDSDRVLSEFDRTQAEDKCLLLIRKPKSASKQMFKAHSLAALNVQDTQLKLLDGTTKPEPHRFFNQKGKRKPELSLPSQYGSLSKQRSYSQGSPTSDLTSSVENDKDAKYEIVPEKQNKGPETKFSYLYPYNEMFDRKSSNLMKSRSSTDIQEGNKEINNNSSRMGGGLTKPRPQKAPPSVPTRTNVSGGSNANTDIVHNENRVLDYTNNNRPDLLSNVDSKVKPVKSFNDTVNTNSDLSWKNSKPQQKYHGNKSESWDIQARKKHDSGFHSDITIPNDQLYYSGFKSELVLRDSYLNDKNVAVSSSPLNQDTHFGRVQLEKGTVADQTGHFVTKEQNNNLNTEHSFHPERSCVKSSDRIGSSHNTYHIKQRSYSQGEVECLNTGNKCYRNPHVNQRIYPATAGMQHSVSNKTERKLSPKSQCVHVSSSNSSHPHYAVAGHSNVHHQHHYDASYVVSAREHSSNSQQKSLQTDHHSHKPNNESCVHKAKIVERNSSGGSNCNKKHSFSPKQHVLNGYSQTHKQQSPKGYSEQNDKKTDGYQGNDNVTNDLEKDDPVLRAQSLGDLSAGCTFSIVGQKKAGSVQALNEPEFTGSQLAKHFRKYREMKPELVHGSLPGRMKCTGNETKVRPKLENMTIKPENQLQVYSAGMGGRCKKQHHYGSLQHLPDSESNEQRHVTVRHREKTPIKPRRTLPQVPGDAVEKKKQYTDMVRLKLASRNSNSPSSRNSNRPHSTEAHERQGGVSATPSFTDKEVSALLEGSKNDYLWVPTSESIKCNNISHPKTGNVIIPPDAVYDKLSLSYPSYSSGPLVQHDQNTAQTGTRHCESGQNTITSQSTVDSGYITNDPEMDNNTTLSTSTYVKSLKESSSKLFKPSKGDHSSVVKGEKTLIEKHHRDSNIRNWIEKHPGTLQHEMKPKLQSSTKEDLNIAEVHPKTGRKSANDKESVVNNKSQHGDTSNTAPKKLAHRVSDSSLKDAEKVKNERTYFRPKVKAVSMSYGLNLIENNAGLQNNNGLSKSQTKFTGSLINLTSSESQGLTCAPSLDSLKAEVRTNNTLPGSWKFLGGNRTESSLKMLGKPSLFQLLQNYNVYPVRLKIPENFSLLDNIRLLECEVVLPSPWTMRKDVGSVTSPKGSYAKLGGPNSAFKPVIGGSSTVGSVSMVTIIDLSNQMKDLYELGQINKGDLIVEVNERLVIGDDFLTLTKLLQTCQGELLLTIARDKARERQKTLPKEEDLRKMEAKIASLTKEMRKKDRTLKQMTALLPWKQGEGGKDADLNGPDIINLSEDEFIV